MLTQIFHACVALDQGTTVCPRPKLRFHLTCKNWRKQAGILCQDVLCIRLVSACLQVCTWGTLFAAVHRRQTRNSHSVSLLHLPIRFCQTSVGNAAAVCPWFFQRLHTHLCSSQTYSRIRRSSCRRSSSVLNGSWNAMLLQQWESSD